MYMGIKPALTLHLRRPASKVNDAPTAQPSASLDSGKETSPIRCFKIICDHVGGDYQP